MLKRLVDVAASAAGLLLLLPLFAVVAALIKIDSPGPVFFRQVRVGRYGKTFRIFKFRTMTVAQAAGAAEITVAGDVRITRIGHWLRRYKLDELPQLIDVLRGTMSLVGPRPEVPRYVERYPQAWRDRVLSVRPGITDYASVHYRNENDLLAQAADPEREYVEVIMPSKLRYALHYVDNVSIADDLRVLGLTLKTVFIPSRSSSRSLIAMDNSRLWMSLERAMSSLHPRARAVKMLADTAVVLLCWHLTYLFRLGFERYQPGRPWYDDLVSLGVVLVYLACLALLGTGRSPWRYFGFDDLKRLTLGCLAAGLLSSVAVLMSQLTGVARAVLVLHPLFCITALSVVRMVYRMVWEHARARVNGQSGEPRRAIVLGAGDTARRLVAGLHLRDGWTVLTVLDDDPGKRGMRISGIPVSGTLRDLQLQHVHEEATHLILAIPSLDEARKREWVDQGRALNLQVLVVPSDAALQPGG